MKLFYLQNHSNIVNICISLFYSENSKIQIRDKQDLLDALTDRDTFIKILQQANDILKSTEYREISDGQDNNGIVDYFMRIKNYVDLNELRFY